MSLNSAELIGNRVNVIWSDGVVGEFAPVWGLGACACGVFGVWMKGVP